MKILRTNFTEGLIWNYISILFLAVGGTVFSFLIGFYYDAETLGNFNLVFAYYTIFSQVGVWGCHMAVTRYISEYSGDREKVNTILTCAILAVCIITIISGGVIWLACNVILLGFLADTVIESMNSIILAVFFFSINKVILGYLNGLSRMKEYAVFQSMRNILITAWIVIFVILKVPGNKISFCFANTEIILFLLEIPLIIKKEKFRLRVSAEWIKKIIMFGTRIMPANIVLELSTRVDILCLSWVLKNEELVGIYSFAALFGEGFYQLFVVVRRNINPFITQSFVKDKLGEFYLHLKEEIRKKGYFLGTTGLVTVILVYRFLCFLMGDVNYYIGTLPLIIIMVSIVCNMKSIILGNILSQTGYPVAESINNVITVATNFVLNIVLIYKWGIVGAAVATGTSYFVFSVNQRLLVNKKLHIY